MALEENLHFWAAWIESYPRGVFSCHFNVERKSAVTILTIVIFNASNIAKNSQKIYFEAATDLIAEVFEKWILEHIHRVLEKLLN